MSWATLGQAEAFTGKSDITQEQLDAASVIVELYADVEETQPEESILDRDRRYLAMANAFQAVWQRSKPGLLEYRESHKDSSADDVRTTSTSESYSILAPLAARRLQIFV